jgi:cytochrome c-type biogenesis protein CcmF
MEQISYAGERLWAGQAGNLLVSLSFAAALLACIGFSLSVRDRKFLQIARAGFYLHVLSVLGIASLMFYMLFNHYFEYQYVWQHSNTEMPMRYIFSCFWEGQEGSFLLWTFWNGLLALILRRQLSNSEWEAPVMGIVSLVQVFLASMILGVYVFGYKIGSSPFLLLREHPDFSNLPFVKAPDYLAKLDGRGLNPLLMNYWMTIHPPTLFLGFASALIPFAFAIGGLWTTKYREWQTVAMPWTYFSILVLGVGILMGGAWAYEALSFGGFWAWDPVENSSLVPWLVLVAAGHTMIINKHKGGSLFMTHFLAITAFLLVLYSTFLTRSGVLGNASVHAFTDLGMTGQLVIYLLTFLFISVILLIREPLFRTTYVVVSLLMLSAAAIYDIPRMILLVWVPLTALATAASYYLYFPREKEEEELYSREFWMFLGSLVLLLSALIITYFTSVPVINRLFGSSFAPPKPAFYNDWILPFALLLLLLAAGAQFLKYRKTPRAEFFRRLRTSFFISLAFAAVCTVPLYFIRDFASADTAERFRLGGYSLFLFCATFSVMANGTYWIKVLNGKMRKAGASVAHIGFGLLMIGVLISTSKKTTISANTSGQKVSALGEDYDDRRSLLLIQGDTLPMGPYLVSYKGKRREGINVYFDVDYYHANSKGKPEYAFTLVPRVQDNPRMGKAPEPATRHYIDRDVYTHVTYADLRVDTSRGRRDTYASPKNYVGHVGDTIFSSNAIIVIDSLRSSLSEAEYRKNDSILAVTAVLRCIDVNSKVYKAYPKFVIRNSMVIPEEDLVEELGLKFHFWKINPEESTIEITMSEKTSNEKDFIVMEAYIFPYINILWLGCLVMAAGTAMAIIERLRAKKPEAALHSA